jgi:hypothetical protein
MKVAVCLSGFARIFPYTYPYLKKYILDPLNADTFFYGYSQDDKEIFADDILDVYKPVKHVIREWDTSVEDEIWDVYGTKEIGRTELYTKPINILSMHYNIFKSNQLKIQYEQENNFTYDLVIRSRTDMFYFREINTTELSMAMMPMTVWIPTVWDFRGITGYGTTDHFAFGSSHVMNLYSNLINREAEYNIKHDFLLHPESMMGYNLHMEGVNRIGSDLPHYWNSLEEFKKRGHYDTLGDFSYCYIDGHTTSPPRHEGGHKKYVKDKE